MTNNATPANRNRTLMVFTGLALVLAGGAFLCWQVFFKEKPANPTPNPAPKPSDMSAAMQANLRGVGKMEQFDYGRAADDFEAAVAAAPDWLPAQINLGIALLNIATPETLTRATRVLEAVLQREPANVHAHYSLGIIAKHTGRVADAYPHFETVSRLDPSDAHTWLHMGMTHPKGTSSAEAKQCFERALKLDPYLNAARYSLAFNPVDFNEARKKQLLDEFTLLANAQANTDYEIKYTKMGRYAEAIGRIPDPNPPETGPLPMFEKWDKFEAKLAAGTAWARSAEFADVPALVRQHFGATVVFLDFNKDGKPDIFLPSAVVREKKIGDLLLRNDGAWLFTDVTVEAGLIGTASWGCAVADYDNDGFPDMFLTGEAAPRLMRNLGNGKFANVSADAGFDKLPGIFLSATWVDLDQDGDLDLLLAQFAESPEGARRTLQGRGNSVGELFVHLNVGEAPAVPPGAPLAPLTTKFSPFAWPKDVRLGRSVVGAIVGDLDNDRDLDILVFAYAQTPWVTWNNRLLRFEPSTGLPGTATDTNGALLLDANHDQCSDILILSPNKPPEFLLSKGLKGRLGALQDGFTAGAIDSPPLRQAQAVDLDMDSWTDVVGLTNLGHPVLLHNDGTSKLVQRAQALGPLGREYLGIGVADLDDDGAPDLLLVTDNGLEVRRNSGNGNHAIRLDLSGRRERVKTASMRSNADGIGSLVSVQAGNRWSGIERTAAQAGLGHSSLPVELGIGKAAQADIVRVRWPDGVPQTEVNIPGVRIFRLEERDRRPSSCPVLFVWDGKRYRYVTDFLGAGTVGEMSADGSTRPPRPEESIKIDPGILAPKDGRYRIKIAEPMDEVLYLDRVELLAIDHPVDEAVYPDERFVFSGSQPTQQLQHLRDIRYAKSARDHRGNDATAVIRDRDRRHPDAFHLRSWLGYAEEHWLEVDFGNVETKNGERLILCLNGWVDYPYPESIFAATQAGVELLGPQLEYATSDGKWKTWGELGFPAGLPRTMTRDVTELIQLGKGRFRIRTNMQVFWDQIALGRQIPDAGSHRVTSMTVGDAVLRNRGFAQEILPDGKPPIAYDDDRIEPVTVTPWKGRLTRLGDVTDLVREHDDRFALCGPGDEIEIAFDASKLPPLPEGHVRSFVLKTWGYCKDSSLFTATGAEVHPLPFRGMSAYPPREPLPQRIVDYDRQWNHRQIGK